jgi:hypothetical protein
MRVRVMQVEQGEGGKNQGAWSAHRGGGQLPDGVSELVLDLATEGAGAVPLYEHENVEMPAGQVFHSITGPSVFTSLILA